MNIRDSASVSVRDHLLLICVRGVSDTVPSKRALLGEVLRVVFNSTRGIKDSDWHNLINNLTR